MNIIMRYDKGFLETKSTYLSGMRVRLLNMDYVQAPTVSLEGMVRGISLLMARDRGSSLSMLLGID